MACPIESMNADWLPVDAVVVDGRPGLWWMDMSGVESGRAVLSTNSRASEAETIARGELFTEFDVLLQLEKALDSVAPTGFIFHSSRCGSTLVANACRATHDSIVLSEANAIDKLIARFITDADERPSKNRSTQFSCAAWSTHWPNAAPATNNISSSSLPVAASRKSNVSNASGPTFRGFFFIRDPVETIVSNMQNRSAVAR